MPGLTKVAAAAAPNNCAKLRREIEIVLDPDDLEEDPDDTIEFVQTILAHQPE